MRHQIALEEVTWEITDNCEQKCSYCGSANSLNRTRIDLDNIRSIADNLSTVKTLSEVNVSGGNPFLVPTEGHEAVVHILKPQVEVKLVVNPFNFDTNEDAPVIACMYDLVGVSINTRRELVRASEHDVRNVIDVAITNFNTANVMLFDELEKYVLDNDLTWQIQLTMYRGQCDDALYESRSGLKYLQEKISGSRTKIMIADNACHGNCFAGMRSMGVLANGDVVPCLSMRSYKTREELQKLIVGNLLNTSADHVWRNGFSQFRHDDFSCCKDVTNCELVANTIQPTEMPDLGADIFHPLQPPKIVPSFPPVFVYGVRDYQPPSVGTPMPWQTQQVTMYGVQTYPTTSWKKDS